jgi:large subunit ribosomal protein L14e
MALLDIGRVCRKTRGRDAGQYCVITGRTEGGFIVSGVRISEKKVSGSHLEPTPWVVAGKDVTRELAELKLA